MGVGTYKKKMGKGMDYTTDRPTGGLFGKMVPGKKKRGGKSKSKKRKQKGGY